MVVMPVLNLRLTQRRKSVSSRAIVFIDLVAAADSRLTNHTNGVMNSKEVSESREEGLFRVWPSNSTNTKEKRSEKIGGIVKDAENSKK